MKALLLPLFFVAACLGPEDFPDSSDTVEQGLEPAVHWGQLYIADHCENCPECCVADLWDAGEDDDDATFCENCPSDACQCFQDEEGRWWIDATLAGTDDDPLNPLVPVN